MNREHMENLRLEKQRFHLLRMNSAIRISQAAMFVQVNQQLP